MSAPVTYIPDFVSNPDAVFEQLWNELAWVHRTPRRREYWTNKFDAPYTYGSEMTGGSYEPQPAHPVIDMVTELLIPVVGFEYEACFLNGYPEARSGLEWHADMREENDGIDQTRPIAVVTVGGGRIIEFVEKEYLPMGKTAINEAKTSVMLEPGSLLLMHAGMQGTHVHRIPKAGYVIDKPRISLTYRSLVANVG